MPEPLLFFLFKTIALNRWVLSVCVFCHASDTRHQAHTHKQTHTRCGVAIHRCVQTMGVLKLVLHEPHLAASCLIIPCVI